VHLERIDETPTLNWELLALTPFLVGFFGCEIVDLQGQENLSNLPTFDDFLVPKIDDQLGLLAVDKEQVWLE
jgi:hypothetical protein